MLSVGLAVVSLAAPVTRTPAAELDPAWSADGRLVFARPDAIVIADPRRGTAEQIQVQKAREPRLSPDGRLVAFDGRRARVEVREVRGGGARLLGYGGGPRWSPDGKLIAFTRSAAPSKGGYVYVVEPDGTGERRVAGNGYDPDWSPDGTHLAFTAGWNEETSAIATVRVAGGEPTELPVRGGGWRDGPAWSPDGSRVAYVFGAGNWAAVFSQPIAAGPRQRVSARLPTAWGVAWRPDGGALAFAGGTSGRARIHLVSSAGRALRTIPGSERDDYAPSWSPDGAMLAFLSERDCGTRVYVAAADGANPRPLTPTDGRPCLIRSGEAFVKGYSTADDLRGGPFGQDLLALGGNDTIAPGGGRDDVEAGAGNDRVYARDGRQDTIRCGTGKDVVVADRIDRVGPSCETIRRA